MRKAPLFWIFLCAAPLCAQSTPPDNAVEQAIHAVRNLDHYRESRTAMFLNDFGQLDRYQAANAALGAPRPGEQRVIFFGDSITDMWPLDEYFSGRNYINRGISGQTTPQMLVRFREDVLDLQPAVVVILAGTNDIAGNTGPMTLDQIEANYATLAELARGHRIRVVFSSVTPVHDDTPRAGDMFLLRSPAKILALNAWLQTYCAARNLVYLDYFSAMVGAQGKMRREYADDGLHPTPAGYSVMAPLAEAAIQKALAQPAPPVPPPAP